MLFLHAVCEHKNHEANQFINQEYAMNFVESIQMKEFQIVVGTVNSLVQRLKSADKKIIVRHAGEKTQMQGLVTREGYLSITCGTTPSNATRPGAKEIGVSMTDTMRLIAAMETGAERLDCSDGEGHPLQIAVQRNT